MAKAPSKRRGITLGARADKAAAIDLLSVPPPPSRTPESDPTRPAAEAAGQPGASAAPMTEQIEAFRRLNADLDRRWRQQSEQFEGQRRQLEQQRDEIARQTRALMALDQRRAASNRVGALLILLALAGVAAVGFHGWPWLRGVAEDVNRASVGVAEIAPQLHAVRGQMAALSGDEGPMESAMAALLEDLAGVRSDLGSLRRAVDILSEGKGAVAANAGDRRSTASTRSHNATTMTNPYWTARPMMPW
jgi:hypothetical protein